VSSAHSLTIARRWSVPDSSQVTAARFRDEPKESDALRQLDFPIDNLTPRSPQAIAGFFFLAAQ
jgi:hypothetical protein